MVTNARKQKKKCLEMGHEQKEEEHFWKMADDKHDKIEKSKA